MSAGERVWWWWRVGGGVGVKGVWRVFRVVIGDQLGLGSASEVGDQLEVRSVTTSVLASGRGPA